MENMYGAIAKRNTALAHMTDKNPKIAAVFIKVALGLQYFCHDHGLNIEDLDLEMIQDYSRRFITIKIRG